MPEPTPTESPARPRARRPGLLWLFFFGRRRRGFPGLLVGVVVVALVLGLSYASRAGVAVSWWIGLGFVALVALLALGGLVLALVAALRPPPRR